MGNLGGVASVEIDAPLEEVWAVVEDVLTAPRWQGGLDGMTALEYDADGRPTLVETENDIKVRRIKAHVRFRYERPTRLSWTQEKGDMKSVDSCWELEDLGNGCSRATYRLDVDPGRVPGLVISGPGGGRDAGHVRQRSPRRAQAARRARLTPRSDPIRSSSCTSIGADSMRAWRERTEAIESAARAQARSRPY
jgi:hypothetical protein